MSNLLQKVVKAIRHPELVKDVIITRNAHRYSDEEYIRKLYRIRFGKYPDLENPASFNEKLNWLKLNDHNPLYHTLVDKYAVKQFVAQEIGEEYVVPCLGVWSSFDEIDWDALPERFVLKSTHDSSGVIIVRDKSRIDFDAVRKHFEYSLSRGWFLPSREWAYKDVPRRIIADAFLDDHSHTGDGISLNDYKFWCFNGEVKTMYVTVKDKLVFENFYDKDFKPMMINHGFDRHQPEFSKPKGFEEMWELAGRLSRAITAPFVRVDFFNVDGKIYFGEFTFYDWAGLKPFKDWNQDLEIGEWLRLK